MQNFHLWIEKAIVTQKLFEQSFKTSSFLTSKIEDVENAETFGSNTSQDISKDSVEGELSESNLKNKRVPANSTGINFKNHKSCRKSRLHGRNIACMSVTNLGCTIDDTQLIVGIQPCDIKSKHSDNSHFDASTDNSGLISDIKIESEIISDICAKNNQRDIRKRRTASSHAQDHCSNESVALANSVPECVYIQENNDTNLEMINESEISPHNSKDLKKDKLVPFENLNFSENQSNVENANSSDLQISELKDEIKPLGKFKRARNKVSSLSKSDYDNCFKKSSQRKRRTAKKDVNVTTSKEIKTNIDSNEEFKTKDQSTRRPFLCSICCKY